MKLLIFAILSLSSLASSQLVSAGEYPIPAVQEEPSDRNTNRKINQASQTESVFANTCRRELENANRTISNWGENMENMVNESQLPATIRSQIHNEANTILDLIEEFGDKIAKLTPAQLTRELVAIRRRSNKMALDIYLNTFDMRWPQNSLQIGIIVERVQQACLDRGTIRSLESPANPLQELLTAKKHN